MGVEPKSKEDTEREELEASLMGGEVAEEAEPEAEPQDREEVSEETPEQSPEEDLETVKARLAQIQEERNSLEQGLRQEREAKKQAERTMATLLDRIETAQKERQQRESVPQEEIPNREEDPAGFLAWQQEQTLAEIRGMKEERQQERQYTQQEQQQRVFLTEYQRQLDEFANKTPDYNEAAQFLAKNRDEELQALGVYDPAKRMEMLHQDALQIGAFCMQQGRNPAQTFYELAKKRGYQGKPPAAPPGKPQVEPKSLSTIGGRSPGQSESLQARADRIINTTRWDEISELDEKEVDKVLRQMG
jgi:hypothetical protein